MMAEEGTSSVVIYISSAWEERERRRGRRMKGVEFGSQVGGACFR